MDILPEEVDSVKTIGKLFDDDVKLVLLKGGFHLFVGKKSKNSHKATTLAGSSHAGIGAHQIAKEYGSDFQPTLEKSEGNRLPIVENKTQYLSSESISDGVELFTTSKGSNLEFVVYKRGVTLGKYEAFIKGDALHIKKPYFNKDLLKSERATAEAISRAMRDKMSDLNLSKIIKE